MNFIKRLRYAEKKIICLCIDVYKRNDGDDFNGSFEVLITSRSKKVTIKNDSFEKYKEMDEGFEQKYFSRTAKGGYKNWT